MRDFLRFDILQYTFLSFLTLPSLQVGVWIHGAFRGFLIVCVALSRFLSPTWIWFIEAKELYIGWLASFKQSFDIWIALAFDNCTISVLSNRKVDKTMSRCNLYAFKSFSGRIVDFNAYICNLSVLFESFLQNFFCNLGTQVLDEKIVQVDRDRGLLYLRFCFKSQFRFYLN